MENTEQNESEQLRRTLVRGAVWSIPIIAAAVAAPQAVASETCADLQGGVYRDWQTGTYERDDENGTYTVGFRLINSTARPNGLLLQAKLIHTSWPVTNSDGEVISTPYTLEPGPSIMMYFTRPYPETENNAAFPNITIQVDGCAPYTFYPPSDV